MFNITKQKPLCLLFLATCIGNAYAINPGLYIGLMAGTGKVSNKPTTTATGFVVSPTNQKPFVGRFYIGYDITRYAGVEFGLAYISRVKFELDNDLTCEGKDPAAEIGAIDFVGKLILPLGPVSAFVKGGVAAAREHYTNDFNTRNPCGKSGNATYFKPTYSIGVGYDLNQNWVVDISYNRIQVKGLVDQVNYWGISFSYHFVNTYCGQFLCDD